MASMIPARRSFSGSVLRNDRSFTTAWGTVKVPTQFFLPK